MSKQLRELLNQLSNKNEALIALNSKEGVTIEELKNASNEIDLLQTKIEAQKKADEIAKNFEDPDNSTPVKGGSDNVVYNSALFTKAIADNLLKQRNQPGLKFTDKETNVITGNIGEDGGYAVPVDMQTKINTILKDTTDLYNLTDYELVVAKSGSRVYETRAKQKPMQPITESQVIPSAGDNPKLQKFTWSLKDLGDFMSIPNDLLKYADASLETWIINWFVDKVRITRNSEILYGVGGDDHATGIFKSNAYTKVEMPKTPQLADFKKAKNVTLLNIFKSTSSWIVNQDGFNYLDSLEDKLGKPYLQPDPKQSTQYLFLGLPVIELPNDVMITDANIPILLGDPKQGYKYVSDGAYQLATTNIGAGAFETNTTKARIMMSMDGNSKDSDALLILEIPKDGIEVANSGTNEEKPTV
ncbi:MAG: phage major capsid protein [Sarcina sp.]